MAAAGAETGLAAAGAGAETDLAVMEFAIQAEAGVTAAQSLLPVALQDLHHPGTRHGFASGKQQYAKTLADALCCYEMIPTEILHCVCMIEKMHSICKAKIVPNSSSIPSYATVFSSSSSTEIASASSLSSAATL